MKQKNYKRISKKEAHDKYGICITGASAICKFYLRPDGSVVDDTNCVRYLPMLCAVPAKEGTT